MIFKINIPYPNNRQSRWEYERVSPPVEWWSPHSEEAPARRTPQRRASRSSTSFRHLLFNHKKHFIELISKNIKTYFPRREECVHSYHLHWTSSSSVSPGPSSVPLVMAEVVMVVMPSRTAKTSRRSFQGEPWSEVEVNTNQNSWSPKPVETRRKGSDNGLHLIRHWMQVTERNKWWIDNNYHRQPTTTKVYNSQLGQTLCLSFGFSQTLCNESFPCSNGAADLKFVRCKLPKSFELPFAALFPSDRFLFAFSRRLRLLQHTDNRRHRHGSSLFEENGRRQCLCRKDVLHSIFCCTFVSRCIARLLLLFKKLLKLYKDIRWYYLLAAVQMMPLISGNTSVPRWCSLAKMMMIYRPHWRALI